MSAAIQSANTLILIYAYISFMPSFHLPNVVPQSKYISWDLKRLKFAMHSGHTHAPKFTHTCIHYFLLVTDQHTKFLLFHIFSLSARMPIYLQSLYSFSLFRNLNHFCQSSLRLAFIPSILESRGSWYIFAFAFCFCWRFEFWFLVLVCCVVLCCGGVTRLPVERSLSVVDCTRMHVQSYSGNTILQSPWW